MAQKDDTKVKTRYYKLLLYADNAQHVQALEVIKEYPKAPKPDYIGIAHKLYDDLGNVILEGEGKLHYHVYLAFVNPVWVSAVCKILGLLKDDGTSDVQFIRPITGRFDNALVYLTHTNAPDKEQYTAADLFGTPALIERQKRACVKYERKEIDVADSVLHILDWIQEQRGEIITMYAFGRWVCQTPYFRGAASPIVRGAIEEHNQRIWSARNKNYMEMIADGSSRLHGKVDVAPFSGESIDDLVF